MDIQTIIIITIIILLIYFLYKYIHHDVGTLSGLMSAKTMQTIESSNITNPNDNGNSANFSYSIWFFVYH